jgi:hypothetical protein
MTEHCDSKKLWRAARAGRALSQANSRHVAECADCLTFWEVIQAFALAPQARLAHAPSGWIQRAIALGQSPTGVKKLVRRAAELSFDSWVTPQVAALRGVTGELSRRLTWKLGSWEIDLRAEGAADGWNCTAQVLYSGAAAPGVELKAGSVQVHTDAAGLVSWSTTRPPRTLQVHHKDGLVTLGPISWKRPRNS